VPHLFLDLRSKLLILGRDLKGRRSAAEREPLERSPGTRLLREDHQEAAQNKNQHKWSDGANMLRLLKLNRQQVSAVSIPDCGLRSGNRTDVLETRAGVVVRNRDAGEKRKRGQEHGESAQQLHTPTLRAAMLALTPPVPEQRTSAEKSPPEIESCIDSDHALHDLTTPKSLGRVVEVMFPAQIEAHLNYTTEAARSLFADSISLTNCSVT
jgi:hypothetical protein